MIRYGKGSLGTITIGVYKGLPLLDPRYVKGNVKPETFTGKENYGVFLVGPNGMEYACEKKSISGNRIEVNIADGLLPEKYEGELPANYSEDFGLKGFYYKAGEATPYEFYLDKVFTIAKNIGPSKDLNLYYDVTVYNVGVDGLSAYQAYITKLKPKTYASEKVWLNALYNVFNTLDVDARMTSLENKLTTAADKEIKVLLGNVNVTNVEDVEFSPATEGETPPKLHIVDNNNLLSFYKDNTNLFSILKKEDQGDYTVLAGKALESKIDERVKESLKALIDIPDSTEEGPKAFKDGGNIPTPNHWENLETKLDEMVESLLNGEDAYLGNYSFTINKVGNLNVTNYAYISTVDPNRNQNAFVVQVVQGNIKRVLNNTLFAFIYDSTRNFYTYVRVCTLNGTSTKWYLQSLGDSTASKALEDKKIGVLGGSQITHAFDNGSLKEGLRLNSFPIKDALLKEGVKEIELKAHEGAGMCIPNYIASLTSGLINVCQLAETIGVCDIYVIQLLTNDYTGNENTKPTSIGNLGDISKAENVLNNTTTFYGALAYTVNTLLNKNPKARILFITPTKCVIGSGGYKTTNAGFSKDPKDGYTIKEEGKEDKPIGILYSFVEALQKFCDYYSYPCLDIFNSGIGAFTSADPLTNELLWNITHLDSTHLNEEGYRQLSHKIVNFIIENL